MLDNFSLDEESVLDRIRDAATKGRAFSTRDMLQFNPAVVRRLLNDCRVLRMSGKPGEVVFVPACDNLEDELSPVKTTRRKRNLTGKPLGRPSLFGVRADVIKTRDELEPIHLRPKRRSSWRLYEFDYVTIRLQEGWTVRQIAEKMPRRTVAAVKRQIREYNLQCR